MFGDYDQMIVIEAPDNFKAYRATLAQEISTTAQTEILPTIDYDLFAKLISTEAGTRWSPSLADTLWAKIGRLAYRHHAYGQWVYPTANR